VKVKGKEQNMKNKTFVKKIVSQGESKGFMVKYLYFDLSLGSRQYFLKGLNLRQLKHLYFDLSP